MAAGLLCRDDDMATWRVADVYIQQHLAASGGVICVAWRRSIALVMVAISALCRCRVCVWRRMWQQYLFNVYVAARTLTPYPSWY